MGKIYTRKILFVIAAMLLCILVAILIRLFFSSRTVRMTLTPIGIKRSGLPNLLSKQMAFRWLR